MSAGHELLYPGHRVRLGAGVLALAAVQLGAARVLAARGQRRDGAALDALGLAALAAAVPVLLGGRLVTPAWSALGTAAVFIATRRRHPVLAAGGVLVIVLAILEALGNRPPHYDEPFVPFFNAAFLSLASPCVALVIAGRLLRGGDALRGAGSFVTLGLWAFTPLLAAEAFHVFHVDVARHGAAARPLGLASATVALAAYTLAVALVTRTAGRLGDRIAVPAWSVPLLAALGFGVALVAMPRDAPFLVALNPLFCAGGFLVAASFFVAAGSTPQLGAAVRLAAVAYSLLLITAEIDAWGRLPGLFGGVEGETRRWRAQVLISVAWAVYAAVLVAAGLGRRRAELRWAGLVLFLLAVVKVFVLDLAQLDVAYRIGSFLALGVLLVAASYLYHRRQDGGS